MEDIDWSKAPEGATHWAPEVDDWLAAWHKQVDGRWYGWLVENDDQWDITIFRGEFGAQRIASFVERPISTEWTGTGLPPVGAVCETENEVCLWEKCTILAHASLSNGEVVLVFQSGDKITFSNPRYFRPIKTIEQIAAEERFNAVTEMLWLVGGCSLKRALEKLHDHGYRKPEGTNQ